MTQDLQRLQLIAMYTEMVALTKCGGCARPSGCCDAMYCTAAKVHARKNWGVELVEVSKGKALFLGENGCVVPPHLRPICSLHHCDIAGLGFFPDDSGRTSRYFEVREQIEELEFQLHGVDEEGLLEVLMGEYDGDVQE